MTALQKNLNALVAIIISCVLLSAFCVQIIWNEKPCPLCLLQRLGMIGVAASLLLNVRFGVRMSHYGLALICSLAGGFVALRQISLHVCPGFPSFGIPVLGLSLYTWSFFVFVCCIFSIACLLFLYDPREGDEYDLSLNRWCEFSLAFVFLIAIANVFATFWQCGLGVCEDVHM